MRNAWDKIINAARTWNTEGRLLIDDELNIIAEDMRNQMFESKCKGGKKKPPKK